MNQIYIFSGLGADERAFQFIQFTNHQVSFIQWILPDKAESMESYAGKLSKQITVLRPIFIGLSFGGMMAVEVAKIITPTQLILVASAKCTREIPFYYRLAGILKLHKFLPAAFFKQPSLLTNWFFGVSKPADKQLLAAILKDTDEQFLKWAIHKIVNWRNKELPENCTHIHGTRDQILPYRFVKADIAVGGGGHFMTVNKAVELTKILNDLLK